MKLKLIAFATLFASLSFGQMQSRYSQNYLTTSFFNPAGGAVNADFTADVLYRNQWLGVDGAPDNIMANVSSLVTDNLSVGINFLNDRIGEYQEIDAQANVAYRFVTSDRSYINMGLGLGINNTSVDLQSVNTTQLNDPTFAASRSKLGFGASFGLLAKIDKLEVSLAIPQLVQNNIDGTDNGFKPNLFHYFISSKYTAVINDDIAIQPSVLLKLVSNSPVQADINARLIVQDMIGFTIGYRTENALNIGLDYTIAQKFRIGYSFNFDVGRIAQYKNTSHEVYLGFGLPFYKDTDPFTKRKYLRSGGNFKRRIR